MWTLGSTPTTYVFAHRCKLAAEERGGAFGSCEQWIASTFVSGHTVTSDSTNLQIKRYTSIELSTRYIVGLFVYVQ